MSAFDFLTHGIQALQHWWKNKTYFDHIQIEYLGHSMNFLADPRIKIFCGTEI